MQIENDALDAFFEKGYAEGENPQPVGGAGTTYAVPEPSLETLMGEQAPDVPLEDIVGAPALTAVTPPDSAIQNQAAVLSLLSSEPAKALQSYQLLVKEAKEGNKQIASQMRDNIRETNRNLDMKGAMAILADKNIPLEQKQQAIEQLKKSTFLNDSLSILHSNALAKGSAGENRENEDARITTADAVREIYQSRKQVQSLVNAHKAGIKRDVPQAILDTAGLLFLPGATSSSKGAVANEVKNLRGEQQTVWSKVMSYLMPGSATMDLKERLANIPPEKRAAFARDVVTAIQSSSGIIFGDDNQFAQFDLANQIFEEGGYSDTAKFIDNTVPLLDVIGLSQLIKGGAKALQASKATGKTGTGAKGAEAAGGFDDIVHKAEWELVEDTPPYNPNQLANPTPKLTYVDPADTVRRITMNPPENPASTAKTMQQANPEQSRNLHEAVFSSEGDAVAEGLYGTSRTDAIVSDVFPQAVTESGRVVARVNDIDRNLRSRLGIDERITSAINNSGATWFSDREKRVALANIHNDFTAVEGLTINDAMTSFRVDGGRIIVGATYGSPEGAFLRAEEAFAQAKLALRNQGTLDEEITILQKQGLDYVPVKLKDVAGKDGNFLVRVDTAVEISANDVGAMDKLDVKRNLFDRMGILVTKSAGSVSRWLFDASSMLHPRLTGAASAASDATANFEKMMLDIASEFSDQFVKLPSKEQDMLNSYIREANYMGVPFDTTDLMARGFSPEAIETVRSWRKFWDSHFYLENYDLVRSLSSNGYLKFSDSNTQLFAKPIPKNRNIVSVYDPAVSAVRTLTGQEIDELYAKGGTMARLRRPANFSGTTAEHMLVRNTPNEYLRKMRDSDQVLNYREGYFQIQYTAPRFVEEIIRDSKGVEIGRRAVAVAGDTKEAQTFADRMARTTGGEYKVRGDIRAMRKDDDAYWDLASTGGRIAQRHRGKLLEDASGLNHLGDGSYILNPADSARRAAMSISGRTVTRPMLDAAKERFLQQYGDAIPKNQFGEPRWPQNVKEIDIPGQSTSKQVADARTTYEYIRYLENGYINTADDVFKSFFNMLSDMSGSAGMPITERGLAAVGEVTPTAAAKNLVFTSYIGSNFLRQWVIQPHQVIRTWAYNPQGWLNGNILKLTTDYVGEIMGVRSTAESKAFRKFVDDSGLMSAVDKSNLVRGTLLDAANSSNKALRIAKKPLEVTRKIGFDVGEQANLLGHAAAVYEKRMRLGQDLSNKAIRDEAYAEIRSLSYNMNFAGDMPYNQTAPSVLLQFMQVPHKALLQLTDRRIPVSTRMRMLAGDIIMWGPPTLLVSDLMGADILPSDDGLRELWTYGVEAWAYNEMFSELAGEKVSIDFSSLAPYELTGWKKFFKEMLTGGPAASIMNSPAGQLFLKDGSRIQQAIASVGRYFGAFDEVGQEKTEFMEMMSDVAKISSGWNNAAKAKLMLETRKRLDQYGNVTDQDVAEYEAWAQLLGFGTTDTRDLYRISKELSEDSKQYKEEVIKSYEDIKRYYANKLGVEMADPRFVTAVTGFAMKAYGDSPVALRIIQQQLSLDLDGKDEALLGLFVKRAQIPDLGNLRDQVKMMPISEEQKESMNKMIDDMEATRRKYKGKGE